MINFGFVNKRKCYLLLGLLLILVIFTTGASCSRSLSVQTDEETGSSAVGEDYVSEEIIEEGLPGEKAIGETTIEGDSGETSEQDEMKPVIILQIMDDYPIYDEINGICYYRVMARVSGKPYPDISFNIDDSNGSWGNDVVRVNINSIDEEVILIATATNSAGSASYKMTLTWGCAVEN